MLNKPPTLEEEESPMPSVKNYKSSGYKQHPLSQSMKEVLAVIADAKNEISGWSVAKWLNRSTHPEGVRESLRGLTNRGLIHMRPTDDPPRQFPDRLNAMYSKESK